MKKVLILLITIMSFSFANGNTVTSISIDGTSNDTIIVLTNEIDTLTATIAPANATNDTVLWESLGSGIFIIEETGEFVSGIKLDTVKVVAKAKEDPINITDTVVIVITAAPSVTFISPVESPNQGYNWNGGTYKPGEQINVEGLYIMNDVDSIEVNLAYFANWQPTYSETWKLDGCAGSNLELDGVFDSTIIVPLDFPAKENVTPTPENCFLQVVAHYGGETTFSNISVVIDAPISINEAKNDILNVYPNPAFSGDIIKTNAEGIIEVYSMSGIKLLVSEDSTINTSTLSKGIYILKTEKSSEIFVIQ